MLKLAIILAVASVCCVNARNRYFLFTRINPSVPQELTKHFDAWDSNFDRQNNTIILIHGHQGSAKTLFNTLVTDSIMRYQEKHNVIVVDWERAASQSYAVTLAALRLVATDLARFLRNLTYHTNTIKAKSMHLVGFGLGAHIAGLASRNMNFRDEFVEVVGRITGLDPTGSGLGNNTARLRNTDAHYVEVIHTDSPSLLPNGIGTAMGHVNFYVNGGSNQPGCSTRSCSHNRAYELFAASVQNNTLVGFPCSSTTQMNLDRCKGSALSIGGTEMFKTASSSIYRINT